MENNLINNGFTKDMLYRVTIITSHYDGNNAWVQNQYAEKTGIFKNLAPGAEGTLLVSEVNMALKGAAENCVVEGVYLIENRNNSDMTEINKIKRTLELRLESKGYKIVNHTPQTVKFNEQAINDWIESHNLYDIKTHQIKEIESIKNELEKQRDALEKEVSSLVNQKEEYTNIAEKAQLFDKICKEDGLDKERIKKMKEFIDTHNQYKEAYESYLYYKCNSEMLKSFETDYNFKRGIKEARETLDIIIKYFKVDNIQEVKDIITNKLTK